MTEQQEFSKGEIKVADISIAHLSRGLYRSTAAAFKELINNAWDADATEVRVYTNYPEFDFISCADNGPGMDEEKFIDYFAEKGIGFGDKRRGHKNNTELLHRPIIGRLGIGMLAIGQLCYSFGIESHYKNKKGEKRAYQAEIDLLDIDIPDIDDSISSDEKEDIKVGNWKLTRIPYDESKQGFRIFTSDVRETFRKEMITSIHEEDKGKMSFKLDDLYDDHYSEIKRSIREKGAYLETIWELCTLCPIPYAEGACHPINKQIFNARFKDSEFEKAIIFLNEKQQKLIDYNFKVIFDGIELKRYITLPDEEDVISRLFFISFDEDVAGRKLKFSGYIFGQNKAIKPYELTGIQIRLRNVGIGGYDGTFLKYDKKIETIRNRWVSGEIFVEDGLEIALNIDRDSFNEHDEHFKVLQDKLHDKLNGVFRDLENSANERRIDKHEKKEENIQNSVRDVISTSTENQFVLKEAALGKNEKLVTFDNKNKKMTINVEKKLVNRKKVDVVVKYVMMAYYVAIQTSTNEEERAEKFCSTVTEILKRIL